ncbi:hypothetical protein FAM09_23585 [Niastella caeni]|uniref:Uncharacterized protein n=1 Tax=Niastella caeni TaxID=2569763 RepID=A0A4S8HMF1_9BACT|nr:class I lanthipeptide [Niastella caeni]THU34974.1 hypothetical protein FAM09_23585 [Niastella caeni]
MKEVKKSKLRLDKKVVTILNDEQQQQVQGGIKAGAISNFESFWACDTIFCCSVPACSLFDCPEEYL